MFAWAFLVWTPVILAIAIFGVAKIPYPASIQIFIFITAIFLPCGILLKWLGNGIIKRKRTQMGFSSILLGFIGFGIMLVSFASRTRLGARIFERFGTGSIILTAAVVVGIGLIERSRISGE
jgi:hypothetical protein